MKVKVSAGRGPALQDVNKPEVILSKRPMEGLSWTSPSPTDGIKSHTRCTSLVEIIRKAAAISGAQLQRGGAIHLVSFISVSNAASLTSGDRSKGSTKFTCHLTKIIIYHRRENTPSTEYKLLLQETMLLN